MASTFNARPAKSAAMWQSKERNIEIEFDSASLSSGVATGETVSLFDFPAGVVVIACQLLVVTAQTTVTDVDLGISATGATSATLLDGVSLAAAAYVGVGLAATVPVNAASQLVLTNKDTDSLVTGKVRIMVSYLDLSSSMA